MSPSEFEAKVRELCDGYAWSVSDRRHEDGQKIVAELVALCLGPSAEAVRIAENVIRCAELDPSEWFPPKQLEPMARCVLRLAGAAPTEGK